MDGSSGFEFDRGRFGWWVVVLTLGAVLAYILVSFVGTFVLGLFVYYSTRPVYKRLKHRIRPRSLAVAVALFTLALPVLLLLAYTVSVGVRELTAFAGTGLGSYENLLEPYIQLTTVTDELRELIDSIANDPRQLTETGGLDVVRNALAIVASYLGLLTSVLLHLFIVLAFAFYLLRDDYRLAGWFRSQVAGEGSTTDAYLTAVDRDLRTIYFGNILTAFTIAIVAAIVYNAFDSVAPGSLSIPLPTLLGLLTGVASLIPVVGMKVVYIPVALFLGADAATTDVTLLWFPLAFFAIVFVVVDMLPELILRPYVSGRNLHVGLVMFAYIIGPLLFGWYGIFLVPLVLVLIVHAARIVLPKLLRGEPVTPDSTAANPLVDDSMADVPEEADEDHADVTDSNVADASESDPAEVTGAMDATDEEAAGVTGEGEADTTDKGEVGMTGEGEADTTDKGEVGAMDEGETDEP